MGEMRIKIEESLLTRIERLAKEHHRSVNDEIIVILEAAAQTPSLPPGETFYEAAVRIAAMTPKGVRQTDSVEILRELRGN